MATAQVKLGLLIVAIVAGTAMGQCDPNKCNYVVDVVSTLGDPSLSIFFAAANWQTVKGPGMNGNFNALASYQFEIADTDCLDPCLLKLRVISGTNPNWVPASVRLRAF